MHALIMTSKFHSIRQTRKRRLVLNPIFSLFLILLPSYADVAVGTDTIVQGGQPLSDGEYLDSANKIFRLQFFSPGNSKSKYVGIFYNVPGSETYNPVWIANRNTPIPLDSLATLIIDDVDGLLKISYRGGNATVSNSTPATASNTSATILDNGNLVLRVLNGDGSVNQTLWQSFDYPTDTFLPGMKLGINFRTGQTWSISSWISKEVPASGSLTMGGDPNGSSQLMMWWEGNAFWQSGLWGKGYFSNSAGLVIYDLINFTYISSENEKYLTYSVKSNNKFAKISINSDGMLELRQDNEVQGFHVCPLAGESGEGCVMDIFARCKKSFIRFLEKRVEAIGNGYAQYENQKLGLFDCEVKCRQNCSCIAFASLYSNGTGCEVFSKGTWFRPLETRDRSFPPLEGSNERVVYFLETRRGKKWWIWLIASAGGTLLVLSIICCLIRKNLKRKGKENIEEKMLLHELADTSVSPGQFSDENIKIDEKMNQVHLFSFESLEKATDNFSITNKLGEGGFGSVYKGKLPSGQEIAIKRLSRSSGQGLSEFKNEIVLIAKLQHDNLVKLLGCCVQGDEKILVYEYMPNRSLDFFLFDSSRRKLLKWTNRKNIIEGVVQGLQYLHKYSRLRVIHRDLKASNVLLDQNMNAKIADFGMARIFGKQELEANTNRIVGTHGYMSPEYAINGVFSIKSDVFSFGVLLLEIVTGKRNRGRYSERPLNLIGLAWELWVEGRIMELMDPTLDDPINKTEMVTYINIALLCVQDDASDRPSMTDVISMLTNYSLQLPEPKQPAFFIEMTKGEAVQDTDSENTCTNDLSISVMDGR